MGDVLDRRRNPVRDDLAGAQLTGRVTAPRFVEGRAMMVTDDVVALRREPQPDAAMDTQALFGERVTVYEDHEGWAWAQLAGDDYVGYLPSAALAPCGPAPSHRVVVMRTFIYPGPSIKLPPVGALPMTATVSVRETMGDFARIDRGYVFAAHLDRVDAKAADFVAVAEQFVGTPYLWGGKTVLGLDCSGLTQIALAGAGIAAPRDTDMMAAELGQAVDDTFRRGDVVFWKGHVGLMQDADRLLHANGHHMLVVSEPLAAARARIRDKTGGDITGVRRVLL